MILLLGALSGAVAAYFGGLPALGWLILGEITMSLVFLLS